jgi:GntR family transcriptional repressor for pyruvate dehydrogenase complex
MTNIIFKQDNANEKITDNMFQILKPITSRGLSDTLLDRLVDMIMDGTLDPGYVFPNENIMCDRLNVGRSTLRETYKALMALGFITRSKKGTVVNETRHIICSVPLNFMFKNSNLNDIDVFRQMLETETAYLAADRADNEQIDEMHVIIEQMKQRADDIESLAEDDISFHLAIATASCNSLLTNTLTAVMNEIKNSASAGFYADTSLISRSIHFHEQILGAIVAHDKRQARITMRAHIKDIYIVLRNISLSEQPDKI